MEIKVRIKKVSPKIGTEIPLPRYATPGSAAFDLHACTDAPVIIPPGGLAMVPTGIAAAIPAGYAGFVFARSGLSSRHGIMLANGVGVIDSDYRGEIKAAFTNVSDKEYTISPGDRIAQMAIMPVMSAVFEYTEELDETERGDGGFGSTGR